MTGLGVAVRWFHLTAGILLTGAFGFAFLIGRRESATIQSWDQRLMVWTRWAVVIVFISGLAVLSHQATVVTGRPAEGVNPSTLLRLLTATQFGTVWLLRHGLYLLMAALILLREREESGWDWAAFRGEGILLGGIGLGLMAWAGHAAAVEPWTFLAALVDAVHLIAVAAWLGGLGPLALLLHAALKDGHPEARAFAVVATRRFSAMAFLAMCILAATGIWNSWNQIGGLPSLVGTRHGHLLLIKLALLVPILALAAINRARLVPALSGDEETVGRPAMTRLARFVGIEFVLGLAILFVVTVMTVTPPGRHIPPWWPFSFRLSWEATKELPGVQFRVLVGSLIALVGLLALGYYAVRARRYRGSLVSVGVVWIAFGLFLAGSATAIDAYPTTYLRPAVPYQAISVANGHRLYQEHCAVCHGVAGYGDGPAARGLAKKPADLTAKHAADHTAGDLFWWLTHGIKGSPMPGFQDRLTEEERWDLVNFLRALAAAEQARPLSPFVAPTPWLVAPDFVYGVGVGESWTLKAHRGQNIVLLVLFTLPHSQARLAELNQRYSELRRVGADILAIPMGEAKGIYRIASFLPVVTDGRQEIVETYALFRRTFTAVNMSLISPHMEFLIDRQGYIRARWIPEDGSGWSAIDRLLAEIDRLNKETPSASAPDEHVH